MISRPDLKLKQIESAVRSFWFNDEQPQTEEERELLNSFDARGSKIYKRLLRNDWQEVLESIYPLSQRVIGLEWTDVAFRYVKTFPPEHFNLNRLAQKFPSYLLQHEQHLPPFLSQLADYEWLELEVMEHSAQVDNSQRSAVPVTVDDFMSLSPTVNPTLSVRDYGFDILELSTAIEQGQDVDQLSFANFASSFGSPSWIAAYRPPGCHYCEFLNIGEAGSILLRWAMTTTTSYGDLARVLISHFPSIAPEQSSLQFINLVERFHEAGIFL